MKSISAGAVIEAVAGLVHFHLRGGGAQGIGDDGTDFDVRIAEAAFGDRDPRGKNHDAGEVILLGLLASTNDILLRGVRPEEGVVYHFRERDSRKHERPLTSASERLQLS